MLKDKGFVVNPYDPCVESKVINGNQMTATWHIDDWKVSCVEEAEVEKFGDILKAVFKKNNLKVLHHCNYVHKYLEIGLDYSKKRKRQDFDDSLLM